MVNKTFTFCFLRCWIIALISKKWLRNITLLKVTIVLAVGEVAYGGRTFRRRLTKLVGMLACSSHSVLIAACMLNWQCGNRVHTLGWKRLLASAMARKDSVETMSTTLPYQYDCSLWRLRTRRSLEARFFARGQHHVMECILFIDCYCTYTCEAMLFSA